MTIIVLDRPRHDQLAKEIRETGARIKFISDGDIAGAILAARPNTGADMLMGIGGSPEGVIAACAMKCLGGAIQAQLQPMSPQEIEAAQQEGLDVNRIYTTNDLVRGEDVFVAATGITDGELLRGIRYHPHFASSHSLVMRGRTRTIRIIESEHPSIRSACPGIDPTLPLLCR
jgi:fructose-1,6-bisphosphatase II